MQRGTRAPDRSTHSPSWLTVVGQGSDLGPPYTHARDQPAAVFGEEQHEHPGGIDSPDLAQANRLLMPAEQFHGAFQVHGRVAMVEEAEGRRLSDTPPVWTSRGHFLPERLFGVSTTVVRG